MLASLLPGLRDIRTPLATGYLWLLGIWLIVADHVPDDLSNLSGAAGDVRRLVQLVGTGAGLAAVSFIAYVVGSILLLPPFSIPTPAARAVLLLGDFRVHIVSTTLRYRAIDATFGRLWPRRQDRLGATFLQAAREQLVAKLDQPVGKPGIDSRVAEVLKSRLNIERSEHYLRLDAARRVSVEASTSEGNGEPRDPTPPILALAMWSELDAVAVQLQAKNRDMWDSYDRLEAEAQFRFAIVPPLVFLVCTYASLASDRFWALWLLLLSVPAVLLVLSVHVRLRAIEVLAQAVNLKLVASPTQEGINSLP